MSMDFSDDELRKLLAPETEINEDYVDIQVRLDVLIHDVLARLRSSSIDMSPLADLVPSAMTLTTFIYDEEADYSTRELAHRVMSLAYALELNDNEDEASSVSQSEALIRIFANPGHDDRKWQKLILELFPDQPVATLPLDFAYRMAQRQRQEDRIATEAKDKAARFAEVVLRRDFGDHDNVETLARRIAGAAANSVEDNDLLSAHTALFMTEGLAYGRLTENDFRQLASKCMRLFWGISLED